jgi:hypothetical protein
VSEEELENVVLESTRTIEIDEFVDREEIDPRYQRDERNADTDRGQETKGSGRQQAGGQAAAEVRLGRMSASEFTSDSDKTLRIWKDPPLPRHLSA